MKPLAFAMLDALGFKGIWRSHDPKLVLKKLTMLRKIQKAETWLANNTYKESPRAFGRVKTTFLSDTVAISVAPPTAKADASAWGLQGVESPEARAILAVSLFVARLLKEAARTVPVLAYRGCVTFGPCEVQERFIIGDAVDRASAMHGQAEGAFVWLAPDAARIVHADARARELAVRTSLVEWDVPMKAAGTYRTLTIAPFSFGDPPAGKRTLVENLAASFNRDDLAVQMKKQNTVRFLAAAFDELEQERERAKDGGLT